MTPGEYLHKRRAADAKTIEQVASEFGHCGIPALSADYTAIEAGTAPITLVDAWLLQDAIDFDIQILGAIAADRLLEPICRVCGCTDDRPRELDGIPCSWAGDDFDLCSCCAEGEGL